MQMPGGGPHHCAPGQFTDDSELAMCLLQALANGQKGVLLKDDVAKMYGKWLGSNPFDIGFTTRNALGDLPNDPRHEVAKQSAFDKN